MNKIDKLDFVRGVAIIMVFGVHYLSALYPGYQVTEYNSFILSDKYTLKNIIMTLNPFGSGDLGVQLFLVISGFLIHLGYLKGGFQASKFFSKRFWRIYPPYFISLIFFLFLSGWDFEWYDILSHVGLFHNLNDSTFFSIDAAYWSLALEMQLYLIYPIFLYLHRKIGLNKASLSVVGLTVVAIIASIIFNFDSLAYNTSVLVYWIVWVAGAYIAENFHYNRRLWLVNPLVYVLLLIPLFLLRLTVIYLYIGPILFSFYFMLVLDWFLATDFHIPQWIFKPITLIGLCSYSIYLYHYPYLTGIILFFSPYGRNNYSLLFGGAIAFLFIFAVSWLIYKWIELPSIKLGTKVYDLINKKKSL